MERFTKGKWAVRPSVIQRTSRIEIKSTDILSVGINPEKDFTFVAVAIVGLKTNKEVQANARLIAAAPDLLKVCQMAMESEIDGSYVAAAKWWNTMKKAIKKATI